MGDPGSDAADYIGMVRSNVQTIVDLYGIESPGLTSSLAIADHVAALIDDA